MKTVALVGLLIVSAGCLATAPDARAGNLYVQACVNSDSGGAFASRGSGDFIEQDKCPGGKFQIANDSQKAAAGSMALWQTTTPPAIVITHVTTLYNQVLVSSKLAYDGYNAIYFWQGGTQQITSANSCCGGMDYAFGINRDVPPSHWFGWDVTCTGSGSNTADCGAPGQGQLLNVGGVVLTGVEYTPPTLLATGSGNLYYQGSHYVRGAGWPIGLAATDDSGVCDESATVDGRTVVFVQHLTPNQSSWLQCGSSTTREMTGTVDTTRLSPGLHSLTFSAANAAGVAGTSKPAAVLVDNTPPTVTLHGPTDASVTAGAQYVTATAGAGPSGVAGIECADNGGAFHWYPGATAQVPVQGLGLHIIDCFSENNAVDVHGARGTSALQVWRLKIGQPTVLGIAFKPSVKALRCHRARIHVHIPGRWVTVHRHHRLVRVRRGGHTRVVRVTRCQGVPRFAPHPAERVAHGRGTTVSGWLGTAGGGTAGGGPLGGQVIQVLTAVDNGLHQFHVTAVARTAPNGTWSTRLPAGPSRLIVARYGGGSVTEGALSELAHLIVPAEVDLLSVSPSHVPWNGTVRITGQLLGGYLPPGGALVRLRIGTGSAYTTYGVEEHVTGDGRFSTTYTFGPGSPGVQRIFWFQLASLPMGNFPYAPAASRRVNVSVGG